MTVVFATQIEVDPHGEAWIAGTNVKVIEVVLDKVAHGWSPEEIHFQHPHLTLAQIHGALTYYYEHQAQFDELIARSRQEAVEMAAQVTDPALRARLAEAKRSRQRP